MKLKVLISIIQLTMSICLYVNYLYLKPNSLGQLVGGSTNREHKVVYQRYNRMKKRKCRV